MKSFARADSLKQRLQTYAQAPFFLCRIAVPKAWEVIQDTLSQDFSGEALCVSQLLIITTKHLSSST